MPRPPSKARHVADQLAVRIAAGDYPPDSWLPAQRDLGHELDVDRGTVGRAIEFLAERDLVEIVAGNGARVKARPVSQHDTADMTPSVGRWRGFGAAVSRRGGEPYTEPTGIREIEAPYRVAQLLAIPAGTVVLERDRIHGEVLDGEQVPVEIATSWITMAVVERAPILREVDTGPGGMTMRLAEIGYELRYEDVVTSRLADSREQGCLRIDSRQPVTDAWRRTYDQSDRVIKASRRIVNPMLQELVYRYP